MTLGLWGHVGIRGGAWDCQPAGEESVEQGNLWKQTFQQIEWRPIIDTKPSPFPPTRPFPPKSPTNCPQHIALVGQVTLPMSGFDLWFSDSFSTSQQIKDAPTLMLQFSYSSSHPSTPTPTFCPSPPHQHPISEGDFWVQRAQVQNRIFCQKPGLPCHSHVWRQQAAIKHLHLWEPKHLRLHLLLPACPSIYDCISHYSSHVHQHL